MAIEIADITTLLNWHDPLPLAEYTTDTAVFANDDKILLIIQGEHADNVDGTLGLGTPVTVGVEWELVASVNKPTNLGLQVYEGTVTIEDTVATVVTFPAIQDQCSVDIINIANAAVDDVDLVSITNIKTTTQDSSATFSLTLDNTANPDSAIFMFSATPGATTFTVGSAQTKIPGADLADVFLLSQYNVDGVEALDCTVSPSEPSVSIGLEILPAIIPSLHTLHIVDDNPATVNVSAGLTTGAFYEILDPGDTNWVAIGAADDLAGTRFDATGAGSGTGTAYALTDVICSTVLGFDVGMTASVFRAATPTTPEYATLITSLSNLDTATISLMITYPNGAPVSGDALSFTYSSAPGAGDIVSVTGNAALVTATLTTTETEVC